MEAITKKSIKDAFKSKKRGRLKLIYIYYRDVFFSGDDLPAHYISELITEDLKFKIPPHSIYSIKQKYEGQNQTDLNKAQADEKKKNTVESNSNAEQDTGTNRKEFTFSDPDYKDNEMDKIFSEWNERQKKNKQNEVNE